MIEQCPGEYPAHLDPPAGRPGCCEVHPDCHHALRPRPAASEADVAAALAASERAELAQKDAENAFWDAWGAIVNEHAAVTVVNSPGPPNPNELRELLAEQAPPEPWLTLRSGGVVELAVRKGSADETDGGTQRWVLSPQRCREMMTTLGMMLRMAGHEPDPTHPWFQGLVIDGDVYHELRHLCREWAGQARAPLEVAITARLATLIEQNEARLAGHRAAVNEGLRASVRAQGHAHLGIGAHPLPAPDLDPDSGP